jgi:hypothetical protein
MSMVVSLLWVYYREPIGTIALPYTEAKGEQKYCKRGVKPKDTYI